LLLPEAIQLQLPPELATQPAVAEATRTQQADVAHHQRQAIDFMGRDRPVGGKQRGLAGLLFVFIEHFDALAPGGFLAVVNLTQIKQLTLSGLAVVQTPRLDHAPVTVKLAVLLARVTAEKHAHQQ
jgi:hypothetical protein